MNNPPIIFFKDKEVLAADEKGVATQSAIQLQGNMSKEWKDKVKTSSDSKRIMEKFTEDDTTPSIIKNDPIEISKQHEILREEVKKNISFFINNPSTTPVETDAPHRCCKIL